MSNDGMISPGRKPSGRRSSNQEKRRKKKRDILENEMLSDEEDEMGRMIGGTNALLEGP